MLQELEFWDWNKMTFSSAAYGFSTNQIADPNELLAQLKNFLSSWVEQLELQYGGFLFPVYFF